ncbi:hypothetical protein BDY17DRAFT_324750 [Neohortaea acidophila]|uniref:SnoaL-like domain-containing protein n=1 Tax=Neohortaea acidophila TaxID=245834 RepID=A0A6A6PQU7_9PEZI|nr:uncharacterized protein BDY17DRAFT_324750 [Neohortaea acidophila]KAF2482470.1 hypothetical protein BDY17DRAFT_324750 [Neohortaea acidophila]
MTAPGLSTKAVRFADPWIPNASDRTPKQAFLEAYVVHVEAGEYTTVPLTKWYSPHCTFHTQNGTNYHGADAIGKWMRGPVFGAFEKVQHDLGAYVEIQKDEESSWIFFSATRNVFLKGNTGETPDVTVPVLWECVIGPAESEDGFDGLQFKMVRLCWDTAGVAAKMRERRQSYQGAS